MSAVAPLQAAARRAGEPGALPLPDNLIRNLSEDEMERYAYLYRWDDPLTGQCVDLVDSAWEQAELAEERADSERDEVIRIEAEHDKLAREVDRLKDRSRELLSVLRALEEQGRLPESLLLPNARKALSEVVR